jgi:GntR family transcriptional regulator/MocR family aminotransferase
MSDLFLRLDRTAGRLAAGVAAELRAAIRSGRLTAGTRLPATRTLAYDLGVSRGVIVNAYEQLVAEGFLTARPGEGTRVAPLALPRPPATGPPAGESGRAPGVRFDLWPGTPDLAGFPRAAWAAAVRQALREMPNEAFGYPDPAGALVLRTELAAYLGRVRAAEVTAERLVVTAGVAQGLSALVRELPGPLAVEEPTSTRQLPLIEAAGAEVVPVRVDEEGLDVAALARTGARAVLVTPAHQYPTGVVLSPGRRAALLAWARDTGGVVLEDDYDAEFRYDREPVGCLQGVDPERVVLFGSVSKSLGPALRLGWVAAPGPLADRVRGFRAALDLGSPVIEQYALARLIASGAYDKHLRTQRRSYRARRDALVAALEEHVPGAVVRGVSAGLHLYVELPYDAGVVAERAAARGIRCAADGSALILGYARLSPPRLAEAARELGRCLPGRLPLGSAGRGGVSAEGIGMSLEEAARQLRLATHDAQVAFDLVGLGDLPRAHEHTITARAAMDAAELLLREAEAHVPPAEAAEEGERAIRAAEPTL